MLALLAAATGAVNPVAQQAEFIDKLVERGRVLLKDAPPSTIRRTGMAISKIASAFPDSTFAAVTNAAMERASSTPTLAELHKYAMSGQLSSVVRANARSLMSVPWRRSLQEDDGLDPGNIAGELTKLQNGEYISEINCANAAPPSELTDGINDLVNSVIDPEQGEENVMDSAKVDAFVTDVWGCFCGLTLNGEAGTKVQALVNTVWVDEQLATDSLPAAATMYTRVTDMISAVFTSDLICSSGCQTTMATVIDFVTALGVDGLEAWLVNAATTATILPEEYETELQNMIAFMPSCVCSIKFDTIFDGAAGTAEIFVAMLKDIVQDKEVEGGAAAILAAAKPFLKDLVGRATGFMSGDGMCMGDCRSMMAWMVKFDLTMLTSIPYQSLADEVVSSTTERRLASIGNRALGQVETAARDTLSARAAHAAVALTKSGTQAYRLLSGGRRLASSEYKDTIYTIGDASAVCICDYFDIDRALDIMDVFDADFFKEEEEVGSGVESNNGAVKALRVAKEFFVFTFSQYGICAGASDGCLHMQTEMARLIGLMEATALTGGLLKTMTVLASSPDPTVESLAVTVPPCYCSQAMDYGNIFDVYTTWQSDTSVAANEPHTEGSMTSIVAGFLSVSKACLSDECKGMMQAVFDFFAGVTVGSTDNSCTAENALKCLADTQADTCPTAPVQIAWMGDLLADDAAKISDDGMWNDIYWSACNMRHTCPAVGTSAYVITTVLKVLAADVDTTAKKDALVVKFVAYVNEQAGAKVLTVAMVTLTVSNSRRGRSLQQSYVSVTFTIETYSELAKQQVTLVTNSESTTVAELSSNLGVTVSEVFTTADVATVTYMPPPPAPGYQDNVSRDDGPNVALIAGIAGGVGGLCFIAAAVALVVLLQRKKSSGLGAAKEKANNDQGSVEVYNIKIDANKRVMSKATSKVDQPKRPSGASSCPSFVFLWLIEKCELNASDAKLYADAFAQLGVDTPEDLQMIDGDEVAWPSVLKPVHRKKIQARLEMDFI